MWNRFDIVEGHLLAYMHCHGGQWSPEYARMCKIRRYYKPGAGGLTEDTLTENGMEIYEAVCAKILGDEA
jgi:hypothetical protein